MEHPNATWNDFSTHLINKDVSYRVSTSFINDEEQNKAQTASLGQELKNLLTLTRRQGGMLQGFVDIVEPMDILLIIAERRCGMKKSRSCRMKPQQKKRLRYPRLQQKTRTLPLIWESDQSERW